MVNRKFGYFCWAIHSASEYFGKKKGHPGELATLLVVSLERRGLREANPSFPHGPAARTPLRPWETFVPGWPVAVLFFPPCTLPKKPATVTEQNSNMAI